MPVTKIGRSWKFKISEVNAWMKSDVTAEKMAKLKAEGKEKITYRQLFANKLQLQAMLSYYRTYGLLDEEK